MIIFAAAFAAHFPALSGGFIWDDDAHLTAPALRSWDGLGRIWFEVGATQQHYPLLHSVFWLEHKLWGDAPLGYHVINTTVHALATCLLLAVLRRLAVPGALLGALIFAVHPVHVETVAWISEQKNTWSALFYLGAALAYLKFDDTRRRPDYWLASGLFLLGLLAKTVVATLPAALLVVFWWRRGRLSWQRDAVPLLPWFVLGGAAGLFTAWVERSLIGAEGAAFDLAFLQRALLAGHVVWFYLGKLLWPVNLSFIYPRWTIDSSAVAQWLPLAGALAFTFVCWRLRHRSRAPLAALLFFGGSLFPVLGFFNVYPFQYSFVADHFQYLASIGVIVFVASAIATVLAARPVVLAVLSFAMVAGLGAMTWRQARDYRDSETLYRATIARNPAAWMAYNNLGQELMADQPRLPEAVGLFERALQLRPAYAEANNNLGLALTKLGRPEEGIPYLETALRLKPQSEAARNNLAVALAEAAARHAAAGRTAEVIRAYERALQVKPQLAFVHSNLANAYFESGQLALARRHAERALTINPALAEAHATLGNVLFREGRTEQARAAYAEAVRLKPDDPDLHSNLGTALTQLGQLAEAVIHYEAAVRLQPRSAVLHYYLGNTLARMGRFPEAAARYEEALRLQPDFPAARQNLDRVKSRP